MLNAFIPISFINSFGVVRHIPCRYTEQDLKDKIISDVPIISAYIFKKRDFDNPCIFIPTFSIKIEFQGDKFPDKITFNFAFLKVETYSGGKNICNQIGYNENH